MEDVIMWVIGTFIGVAILFLLALIPFGIFVSHVGATNSGEHTGYITAVEQEGVIWKTWRAYVKTDPQSSQEDEYCITDQSVVTQLKNDSEVRKLVTVQYSAPFIVWNWQCGNEPSIITGIK